METKIGTSFQYHNSSRGGMNAFVRRNMGTNFTETHSANADTFTKSARQSTEKKDIFSGMDISDDLREQLRSFHENIKNAVQIEARDPAEIANSTPADKTKFNFDRISTSEKALNENIFKKLEEAGVPKDVTFEFDYSFKPNFSKIGIEITKISDENYREIVKNVLENGNAPFTVISCASRVMNGYASSLYYPCVSSALDNRFEQDINDLYIDENGNLGGINEKLQAALDSARKAEKRDEYFSVSETFGFSANSVDNAVNIIKCLVSDKNVITPNISHMGYDGEQIYTNDGEFKFGKDFDPNLFGEEKYVMRGTTAFFMTFYGHIDLWAENYDKFQ